MPEEIINTRLNSFTPEYREFVTSDFADTISLNLAQQYLLDNDSTTACENMIFLYLVLILNKFELAEAFAVDCGLTISQALEATNSVIGQMPIEMTSAQEKMYMELTNDETAVSEKNRFSILNQLPTNRQLAYLFAKTNPLLDRSINQLNLDPEIKADLSTIIGDIILGFYKIEDTVPLLQQELGIDPKTAALLGAELFEFLALLSDTKWQPPIETMNAVHGVTLTENSINRIPVKAPALVVDETVIARQGANVVQTASESSIATITTAPSYTPSYEPSPVPEQVHQSTQPITERLSLSPLPSYSQPTAPTIPTKPTLAPDRPRWSTEI